MKKIIFDNSLPIYKQVVNHIKNMIHYGYITSGCRLPVRKLMNDYGISKNIIEKSLGILKEEGIIETIPRTGSFVSKDAHNILTSKPSPDWEELSARGMHRPSNETIADLAGRYAHPSLKYRFEHSFYPSDFHPYDYAAGIWRNADLDSFVEMMNIDAKNSQHDLKQAVIEHERIYGINAKPENILFFDTVNQAVTALFFSFLGYGSNIYAMRYDGISSVETLTTGGVNKYWLGYDNEGILPDEIEKKVRPKNSMLYLMSVNHYPTGITLTESRRSEILDVCQRNQIAVIENTMSKDVWRVCPPRPLKSDDEHDQIFYIGSFATTFNTGFQGAWVIAPSSALSRLINIRQQLYDNFNRLNEYFLTIVLRDKLYVKNMEYIREINKRRLPLIEAALEKHCGGLVGWEPANIDYHLWLEFAPNINTRKIFVDCSDYLYFPGQLFNSSRHILLNSVCESVDRTIGCIKAIAEAVRAQR